MIILKRGGNAVRNRRQEKETIFDSVRLQFPLNRREKLIPSFSFDCDFSQNQKKSEVQYAMLYVFEEAVCT